jgi:dUTP pyrophosphatase
LLLVKKLDPNAKLPTVANRGEDLAYDLYALEDAVVMTGIPTKIRTGISAYYSWNKEQWIHGDLVAGKLSDVHIYEERREYGLLIRDRSSMASKGVTVVGGVIDAGYRGEIVVILHNFAPRLYATVDEGYIIKAGDKIAQMIPLPVNTLYGVKEVDELPTSSRGDAGFGSTGR